MWNSYCGFIFLIRMSISFATLGFAFSRSMYYAKMVEGIVDASEEYHRKLIDNTYDELYNNEDAKVFKYIYYLNIRRKLFEFLDSNTYLYNSKKY